MIAFSGLSTRPVLKGCCHQVVVVRSPGPLFDQAIFLLRDECLDRDPDRRKALLQEAREAAGLQSAGLSRRVGPVWPLILAFLSGAGSSLLSLWLLSS